ncbi:hypothetical protein B0H13DRAFT_1861058 [Mycena leptocephala]|nr:hypothetical protein B0H13DRAFT_1861058 [Mycena leptocephala]
MSPSVASPRLNASFVIPRTTSLFDVTVSDDEPAGQPPARKKAKAAQKASSPAPSVSTQSHYHLQGASADEDTHRYIGLTPAWLPKSPSKATTIKAECNPPTAGAKTKKMTSPPENTPEPPRHRTKQPAAPPPEDDDVDDKPADPSFPDYERENANYHPTNRTGDPTPPVAVELVSAAVVHDGVLPTKGHRLIYICTACSTRVTICVFHGWHVACYACKSNNTKCSFSKGPLHLLQSLGRLRPLQSARATGKYALHSSSY